MESPTEGNKNSTSDNIMPQVKKKKKLISYIIKNTVLVYIFCLFITSFSYAKSETQEESFINKSLKLSSYCCSVGESPLLNWT